MAVLYVRSTDGNDADDGSTWALAKATLAGALAVAAAGDTIWVSQAHAGSQASSMTLTSPGTLYNPVRILCGNDAAEPPTALATTATITTTGNNNITMSGCAIVYGVTFSAGNGSNGADLQVGGGVSGTTQWRFYSCVLKCASTGNSPNLVFGSSNGSATENLIELHNTNLETSSATGGMLVRDCTFLWQGGAWQGATIPTTMLGTINKPMVVEIRNVDLSVFDSGKNLVDLTTGINYNFGRVDIHNCKLGASVNLSAGTPLGNSIIRMNNCDSADTNYRYQLATPMGDCYSETSVLLASGGMSDGTTPFSRRIVTNANASFWKPFVTDDYILWNDDTGSSKTATIEFISDNITFKNNELWVEIGYLGTSGFPLGVNTSNKETLIGAGSNLTTSSVSWNGTGGFSSPVKQKVELSFTPQEKGPVRMRVFCGKASSTVYVNFPGALA